MTIATIDTASYREWKAWSADAFGKIECEHELSFHHELVGSGVRMDKPLRILEIGFGNGGFAQWTRGRGYDYTGTEIDPELVSRAKAAGFRAISADANIAEIAGSNPFDVIVAFDVFEHMTLKQITDLLNVLATVLAPDGCIIARFPSGDSPFSGSMQNGDLTHRTLIGSGLMRQLVIGTDLHVAQARGPVLPIRGLGLRRFVRRLAVLGLRSLISKMINIAYHDNGYCVVSPNMVVVLRIRAE